ncbi:angiopoietin-related protein 5 [Pristis pectinata]|uniref:angiopoietin-related protein 5 n=1 Tax=Pristis pectinata TaxID=685728 RepID=UPI00223C8F8A|nr:angiopoietin-related protein 5 [Pristis pectinata]
MDGVRPCEMPRRTLKEEKHYLCRNLHATLASYTRNTKKLIRNMMERQQQSVDYLAKQMRELMNRMHLLNSEFLTTDTHQFPTRPVQSHGFDCTDIKDTLGSLSRAPSGIYIIQPEGADYPFEVFCEMDFMGGGWTVIQKRIDGTIEFVRTWAEYMDGFGDLSGEFWLGLRNIFHIVNQKNVKFNLLMTFESDDETTAYASYEDFYIGDESEQFKLRLGHFTGTAGDAFRGYGSQDDENGMPFSTFDCDNDGCNPQCNIQGHLVDSCSVHHNKTGWWYNQCGLANLNEAHLMTEKSLTSHIRWETWKQNGVPIKIKSVSMNLLRSRPHLQG